MEPMAWRGIRVLFVTPLLLLLLVSCVVPSFAAQRSGAWYKLHEEMVRTIPMDWSGGYQKLSRQYPIAYALTIGLTMRRQRAIMGESEALMGLHREVVQGLKDLARELNYRDPSNNELLKEDALLSAYINALEGRVNQLAKESWNFDPDAVPMKPVFDEPDIRGKLAQKDPTINLLGVESGEAATKVPSKKQTVPVTSSPSTIVMPGGICPMRGEGRFWVVNGRMTTARPKGACVECTYHENGLLYTEMEKWPNGRDKRRGSYYFPNGSHSLGSIRHWNRQGYEEGDREIYGYDEASNLNYLKEKTFYRQGKENGVRREYLVYNGQRYLHIEMEIVDGVRHGKHFAYNPNGTRSLEARWENGDLKERVEYDKQGNPKWYIVTEQGREISRKRLN